MMPMCLGHNKWEIKINDSRVQKSLLPTAHATDKCQPQFGHVKKLHAKEVYAAGAEG